MWRSVGGRPTGTMLTCGRASQLDPPEPFGLAPGNDRIGASGRVTGGVNPPENGGNPAFFAGRSVNYPRRVRKKKWPALRQATELPERRGTTAPGCGALVMGRCLRLGAPTTWVNPLRLLAGCQNSRWAQRHYIRVCRSFARADCLLVVKITALTTSASGKLVRPGSQFRGFSG